MVGMGTLLMAMAMVEDIDHRIIDLQTDLISQDLSTL
jgi:hypothetical protein